jgi:hypothetical protein
LGRKTGNRVVQINLSKVEGEVIDLTNKTVLDNLIKFPMTKRFATKSQEVLVKGFIPNHAIKLIP